MSAPAGRPAGPPVLITSLPTRDARLHCMTGLYPWRRDKQLSPAAVRVPKGAGSTRAGRLPAGRAAGRHPPPERSRQAWGGCRATSSPLGARRSGILHVTQENSCIARAPSPLTPCFTQPLLHSAGGRPLAGGASIPWTAPLPWRRPWAWTGTTRWPPRSGTF